MEFGQGDAHSELKRSLKDACSSFNPQGPKSRALRDVGKESWAGGWIGPIGRSSVVQVSYLPRCNEAIGSAGPWPRGDVNGSPIRLAIWCVATQ